MRRLALLAVTVVGLLGASVRGDDTVTVRAPVTVGEWCLQKDTNLAAVGSPAVVYLYSWVAKIDGKKITVMHQLVDAEAKRGLTKPNTKTLESLGDAKLARPADKYEEEFVVVKAKKLLCRKVAIKEERLWVSPDVPVYGLVRAIVTDAAGRETRRSDLVDWGLTGGSARATR